MPLIPNITAIAEAVVATIKAPQFNTTITQVLAQAQLVVAVVDTATVVSAIVKEAVRCPAGFYSIGSDIFNCAEPCAPGTYQTKACSASSQQVCTPCGAGSFCLGGLHRATCTPN